MNFYNNEASKFIKHSTNTPLNLEQWKYTNYKKFDSLRKKTIYKKTSLDKTPKANEIIFVNGRFLIMDEKLNNQIFISSIESALKKDSYNCTKYFNEIIPLNQDLHIAYNMLFFKYGIFIHVKDNAIIDAPITIRHYINNISCLYFIQLISIGKNVSLQIITKEGSLKPYCINSTCEAFINKNSQLDIIQSSEKKNITQIFNFSANIEQDSTLKFNAIDISGKLLKNNYFINLIGKNSRCYFNGLNVLDRNDHIDTYIEILHKNKFTYSNLNFKLITNGKSKSILYAKAIIEKLSSNSEAYQNNKNLMLSPTSTIHATPQLQIYNNDVQCSHASATGTLDEEMIYYMETRGININDGKQLILKGFADEIINRINIDSIQLLLKNKIETYFNNVYKF